MTSRHSSETTASSAANTSRLTEISSKTASITRSQPPKADVSAAPLTIEPRKRAFPSPSRPRDDLLLEVGANRSDGLLDARRRRRP